MTDTKTTGNLYYLQVDHRHEGDSSWEEMVVCSSTPEEALKITGFDTYIGTGVSRVHVELIGVALGKQHGVVCVGDHSHTTSFDLITEKIRYKERGSQDERVGNMDTKQAK